MKTSELVFNYLKEQGLCPKYDEDNDIVFKYQMLTFVFFNSDEDGIFFRLSLPGIYDVTDENRVAVLEAMNEVNKMVKVVKLFIPNDDVWASTEITMDSTPVLDDMVPHLLNILIGARKIFYDQIE
jgi:hypothetical protein